MLAPIMNAIIIGSSKFFYSVKKMCVLAAVAVVKEMWIVCFYHELLKISCMDRLVWLWFIDIHC